LANGLGRRRSPQKGEMGVRKDARELQLALLELSRQLSRLQKSLARFGNTH
jgi:hypothetical protein